MFVKQAANALDILEYFAQRLRPATPAEIADDLGWPRSSTLNIVSTLTQKGFLYEPRSRAGYYPSPRWQTLAEAVSRAEPLPEALYRIAAEVAEQTGETTAVSALAGISALFVHVVESQHFIRYFARVGDRVPVHASSVGRALLIQIPDSEREALYRKIPFAAYSSTTPMNADEIKARLRNETARGFHYSDAEYQPDLAGVALPLPAGARRLSIVVAGPVSRVLPHQDKTAEIIRRAIAHFPVDR